jgi:hypothetical protein
MTHCHAIIHYLQETSCSYAAFYDLSLDKIEHSEIVLPPHKQLGMVGLKKYDSEVHICYLDLEKDFDIVPRREIWCVLKKHDVEGSLVAATTGPAEPTQCQRNSDLQQV